MEQLGIIIHSFLKIGSTIITLMKPIFQGLKESELANTISKQDDVSIQKGGKTHYRRKNTTKKRKVLYNAKYKKRFTHKQRKHLRN